MDDFINGDGTFLYPGEDKLFLTENRGLAGPLSSIRAKNWRRGAQDFEYLWLAKRAGFIMEANAIVENCVPPALWEARHLKATEWYSKLAPDLIRIDAVETTNLLDEIEIAIPKLDALGTWHKSYEEARRRGVELWFYTVGIYQGSLFPNKTIDLPVMNSRIMHWLNFKYDATGFLHWGWNQWEEDPFNEVGMHIGDGWHVYPAKDGVLNSLRWEQLRNGIQDYECFWMLEDKIKSLKESLGARASWIDPSQRGKEISSRIVMSFDEHSDNPQALYNAKKELIKELISFNTSPEIYVQTNPTEGSSITFHSSVELYGWTVPGTKIIVNGKELPVTNQGYFFEQFGGEALDNTKTGLSEGTIYLQATKDGKTTEIVRRFNVKR
jgi:hypothetical protein